MKVTSIKNKFNEWNIKVTLSKEEYNLYLEQLSQCETEEEEQSIYNHWANLIRISIDNEIERIKYK